MAAYTIFFIAFMIIFVGIVVITFNVAIDELISNMNPFITAGEVSKQFVTYWNFSIGLWEGAFIILFLIALAIWAIVRAIERRQEQELMEEYY